MKESTTLIEPIVLGAIAGFISNLPKTILSNLFHHFS